MSIQRRARRALAAAERRRGPSENVRLAFDPDWYRARYPQAASSGDPLHHYLETGWRDGLDPCSLFDTDWYLQQNRDVVDLGLNPLAHYVDHGWAEGRDPSPIFSTSWYLHWFPGRGAWSPDPMTHFRTGGWRAGHGPHPLFDVDWYLTQLARRDLPMVQTDPLTHFAEAGWRDNLDPNPLFDTEWYRARNPDLDEQGVDPLRHYVTHGAVAGADPSAFFSTTSYAARNPQCGGRAGALAHYLEFGRSEGVALPISADPAPSPAPVLEVAVHGDIEIARSAERVAIVAGHDGRGSIGAATRHLVGALRDAGYVVVLAYDHPIDGPMPDDAPWAVVVACAHGGYDFFSWRLALERIGLGHRYEEILMMNDSVIGPIGDFGPMLAAWRALPFSVAGLLESTDPRPHLQSWGVLLSGDAATTDVALGFYGKAAEDGRKGDVIDFLEIPLAEHFRSQGFGVGSLFSHVNVSSVDRNPAIFGWRELLDAGLVFVKREALALPSAITWTRTSDIIDAVSAREPDAPALIADALAQIGR